MSSLESKYDFVIVGSGGGSMCAALAAKRLGKRAVILEKRGKIGGSTGFSGGVWWVPNNALMARQGIVDSYEMAKTYFEAVVTYKGPAVTRERRDAFLNAAPRMVRFLEQEGMKFRRPRTWPDYYDDLPGGVPEGRSLMAVNYNIRRLGKWADRLSTYAPMRVIPVGADLFPTLFMMKRTIAGKIAAARVAAALMAKRLFPWREIVANGAAIQGRMLEIALREQLPIFPDTAVVNFIVENNRIAGVVAEHEGNRTRVLATDGVLVNAGGFSRNQALRDKYQRRGESNVDWTNANPGDTGEVLEAMIELGAATDCMDTAWWVPTSRNLDGSWPKGQVSANGSVYPSMHHLDLSLPHLILVDQDGKRVADESGAYMEIGERMYDRQRETGRAIPCWTIFERRNRERYPWGAFPPGVTPQEWIESGYMKKADTLEELADMCGIDKAGLLAEVKKFNGYCRAGVDPEFNRGGRSFDRAHGDPTNRPNFNLGALEEGPFYAVAMYPGDVGTAGGVVTDQYARVLRSDGSSISGLYATGNSTASVFGRVYPGAGASIAASFTFALIAAYHSAGVDDQLGQLIG